METKGIKYLLAYYAKDMENIAKEPIWKRITVRGVNLSRKATQQAYKEMKVFKFKGNIIDYICYICLLDVKHYVLSAYLMRVPIKEIIHFLEIYLILNEPNLCLICRLALKDETYITDSFKDSGLADDQMINSFKEMIFRFVNSKMNAQPTLLYQIGKLKHG